MARVFIVQILRFKVNCCGFSRNQIEDILKLSTHLTRRNGGCVARLAVSVSRELFNYKPKDKTKLRVTRGREVSFVHGAARSVYPTSGDYQKSN